MIFSKKTQTFFKSFPECVQLSLGDAMSYVLSTAENELGVVIATSAMGECIALHLVIHDLSILCSSCFRTPNDSNKLEGDAMSANICKGASKSCKGAARQHSVRHVRSHELRAINSETCIYRCVFKDRIKN